MRGGEAVFDASAEASGSDVLGQIFNPNKRKSAVPSTSAGTASGVSPVTLGRSGTRVFREAGDRRHSGRGRTRMTKARVGFLILSPPIQNSCSWAMTKIIRRHGCRRRTGDRRLKSTYRKAQARLHEWRPAAIAGSGIEAGSCRESSASARCARMSPIRRHATSTSSRP